MHEIVFYGKGGYDWNTVYNFPVWLRKLTYNLVLKSYQQRNEANEASREDTEKIKEKVLGQVPDYILNMNKKP